MQTGKETPPNEINLVVYRNKENQNESSNRIAGKDKIIAVPFWVPVMELLSAGHVLPVLEFCASNGNSGVAITATASGLCN